jgi:carbon-monoxide dehydrogenase large subunit
MGEYALGQPVPRTEDPRLLRGGGRYISDMVLPGMLHGYVLRAPHAHAKILSIDTTQAKRSPGVHLILTGDDWIASGWGDLSIALPQKRRDGSPMAQPKHPALVKDKVRRVGDYVAFIVADSVNEAKDAAELIEVDYEPLPALVETAKALDPDAPQIWDEAPGNICYVYQKGDAKAVDEAFARAPHIVKQTMVINRVIAAAMEPRGCIGDFNRADDHYTLYTTVQGIHPFRSHLANSILKTPESKVRVVAGDIGGSFGMKSGIYNENCLVLLASKLIGKPVKWVSERSETFLADAHARDNISTGEMAVDNDGKFLAFRIRTIANLGAYLLEGTAGSPIANVGSLAGVYTIPAMDLEVTTVFTNVNPLKAYRGNGRPEAAYVIERMVDLAADKLGISAAEIRRRNNIPPSAMPYKTALIFTYDCGEFEKNMDLALEMGDVKNFPARKEEARKRGKLLGLGISNTIERAADGGTEGAEVRFDRSGTITILSGSVSQGQGHETVYKQMVADRFGMNPREISYVSGDSDKVAYGQGTGGSRSATIGGSALLMAVNKVEAKARAIAAHLMEAAVADVEFKEGTFTIAGTDRKVGIKEVAKAAADPKNLPAGMEPGLVESAVYAAPIMNFPNGVHVIEVEIDEETGVIKIVRYNVVDDVGTVLNPLLLKGQIHGGIGQGVGQMLMEDLTYDPNSGQLLAASFMDYAMPRATDMTFMEIKSNPVPTKTNPLGVKGAGEAGNVGALPALANAIVDALSHLGITNVPMPATSERIWRLMQEAKGKAA